MHGRMFFCKNDARSHQLKGGRYTDRTQMVLGCINYRWFSRRTSSTNVSLTSQRTLYVAAVSAASFTTTSWNVPIRQGKWWATICQLGTLHYPLLPKMLRGMGRVARNATITATFLFIVILILYFFIMRAVRQSQPSTPPSSSIVTSGNCSGPIKKIGFAVTHGKGSR